MKTLVRLLSISLLGCTLPIMAGQYVLTLPEFSGLAYQIGDPYPLPPVLVGNFNYTLQPGESIVSAEISGQWGNSGSGTTARNRLYLNGFLVADTAAAALDPYFNVNIPWSHTFLPSEFSVLQTTPAAFQAVQTSEYIIRLGPTTLTINTVPEPTTLVLTSLGVLAAVTWGRRSAPKHRG